MMVHPLGQAPSMHRVADPATPLTTGRSRRASGPPVCPASSSAAVAAVIAAAGGECRPLSSHHRVPRTHLFTPPAVSVPTVPPAAESATESAAEPVAGPATERAAESAAQPTSSVDAPAVVVGAAPHQTVQQQPPPPPPPPQSGSQPARQTSQAPSQASSGRPSETAPPLGQADGTAGAPAADIQRSRRNDEDRRWATSLGRVIDSLVSIKYVTARNFDTWRVGSYSATGFIVDATNGLILTNKHVITDAPFIGKACFRNGEEVAVWPIWRDPVHDFGFLKFNPAGIHFMHLTAVPLAPERVRVGLAVRVPGSDAGEKLAVLQGIIARIDRPAANYGIGTYNDFNVAYIQCSANTSGGSSGSPVIDIDGYAVAMNAGGSTHAASSFFLPLHRVQRALHLIQNHQTVPRGTLQVEWVQKEYNECRRLGLSLDWERTFRETNPLLNGALTVKGIVPGGPADGILQTGDVLLTIENHICNDFVHLAEVLDDKSVRPPSPPRRSAPPNADGSTASAVAAEAEPTADAREPPNASAHASANEPADERNSVTEQQLNRFGAQSVKVQICRYGQNMDLVLPVQSLYAITPARYVEIGGAVIHNLSYSLARSYLHPCSGVYLADAGHMFGIAGIASNAIVTTVDHKSVSDIDEFVTVMQTLAHGERVPVRYYALNKKNVELVKVITVEYIWGRFRMAVRNDHTGLWNYSDIRTQELAKPVRELNATFTAVKFKNPKLSTVANKVMPSLCRIFVDYPIGINGENNKATEGTGIVIDHVSGLVLTDRNTIITALGKPRLTFANNVTVLARILWIHPLHNAVFLRYDTVTLMASGLPVRGITYMPDASALCPGDEVAIATVHNYSALPRVKMTLVRDVGAVIFSDSHPPRSRTINWDTAITLTDPLTDGAGVLTDKEGRVRAAWLINPETNTFCGVGLEPGAALRRIADYLVYRERACAWNHLYDSGLALPAVVTVDIEVGQTYFYQARDLGLSEHWIDRIASAKLAADPTPPLLESETHEVTDRVAPSNRIDREGHVSPAPELLDPDEVDLPPPVGAVDPEKTQTDESSSYSMPGYDIFTVRRVLDSCPLKEGDILLTADGVPITRLDGVIHDVCIPAHVRDYGAVAACGDPFLEADLASDVLPIDRPSLQGPSGVTPCMELSEAEAAAQATREQMKPIQFHVLRNGKEVTISVPRVLLSGAPRVDIFQFGGAIIQQPHRSLAFSVKSVPKGMYISLLYSGSPAQRDHVSACWFITEVNGRPVPDMPSLMHAFEGANWRDHVAVANPLTYGWRLPGIPIKGLPKHLVNAGPRGSKPPLDTTPFQMPPSRLKMALSAMSSRRASRDSSAGESPTAEKSEEMPSATLPPAGAREMDAAAAKLDEVAAAAAAAADTSPTSAETPASANPTVNTDQDSGWQSDSEDARAGSGKSDAACSPGTGDGLRPDDPTPRVDIRVMPNLKPPKTFTLRMVNLERVQRVLTLEICEASQNYFPSFRAIV